MQRHRRSFFIITMVLVLLTSACTHRLQVKNLDTYASPIKLSSFERPLTVAVLPYEGPPDGLFYFNALVERLTRSPGVADLRTDYLADRAGRFRPDLILSIDPKVTYRSSGWNFLINWPGFLIFTPAWNGYVYRADIMTDIAVHDGDANVLSTAEIPISYNIREAEMDRTIWTGLTWLEVSALALIGGVYNANVFDRDIIGTLETHVKDNYSTYVMNQLLPKLRAAETTLPAVAAGTEEVETSTMSSPEEKMEEGEEVEDELSTTP